MLNGSKYYRKEKEKWNIKFREQWRERKFAIINILISTDINEE